MIALEPYRRKPRRENRTAWIVGLLLVAGVIGAYSNHFHNEFHFDDSHTIVNNAFLRDLKNIPRFFTDATTFSSLPSNQSYRPVVSTMLAIDYWLGGRLDPFWFQVTNFLGFLALVLLVGRVIDHLLEEREPAPCNFWLAASAAGWFGLHPANADTVNYIIAGSDLFSTLAVVGSLAIYQLAPGSRRTGLYVIPAVVGILAKPIAAMFVPLLAIACLLLENSRTACGTPRYRRGLSRLRPVLPAVIGCGAMALFVQMMTPRTWVAGAASARQYLITQPYVTFLYFKTFFWPTDLSADYDLGAFQTTHDPRFWVGIFFLLVLVSVAVSAACVQRTRLIGFGLLWFLIALLPTALCPLAEVMNSHRTLFPYAGLLIAVVGAVAALRPDRWFASERVRALAVLGIAGGLFLCGVATYQRNRAWKDEGSLWQDVTIKSPDNGRGLMNYGNTLMAKGDYRQALEYYERAERLTPQYSTLFINRAIAEGALGHADPAEQGFKTAVRLAPENPNSYTYYARWLLAQHRTGEAVGLLRKALALSPGDLFAGELLRTAQAAGEGATAVSRAGGQPSPETYLDQSLQLYNVQRYAESIAAAEQALQLRPGYAAAYNNICAAYNQLGQYERAIRAGEEALCYQPDFQLAANNLQYARQQSKVP